LQVASWVFENFDSITGLSFFPYDGHVYEQAPIQAIDKATYVDLQNQMPKTLDFEQLKEYEKTDNTNVSQELACTSGACAL